MNHKFIADFRNYDLTLTTSMNSNHGVSGHLFELIEYFYYFRFWHNIKTNILIPFELTKEQFKDALKKYNFDHNEILEYLNNTFFIKTPQIFFGNIVIFTDGNMYHPKYYNGIIKCNKKIFLRCNNNETLDKADIILQDFRLYDNTKNAIHYVKKLLFDKMIRIKASYTNTALLYATSNCRMVSYDEMEILKSKYNFGKYIVLSDKEFKVPDKFELLKVPADNIFSKFDTYIYTPLHGTCSQFDCSPRFIAECEYYSKKVIYEIPVLYHGLTVRKYDIENNFESLFLRKDDKIINYI